VIERLFSLFMLSFTYLYMLKYSFAFKLKPFTYESYIKSPILTTLNLYVINLFLE